MFREISTTIFISPTYCARGQTQEALKLNPNATLAVKGATCFAQEMPAHFDARPGSKPQSPSMTPL